MMLTVALKLDEFVRDLSWIVFVNMTVAGNMLDGLESE